MARAVLTLSKRLLSATSITHAAAAAAAAASVRFTSITHSAATATPSTSIRCYVNYTSKDSPFNMVSTLGDWESTEVAAMFAGTDYRHWFVHMDDNHPPGGEGATKRQIIDCYIKTLAKVVGSEEEAKKKIYKVNGVPLETHVGFGCELDWETAAMLEKLPNVSYISPDFYRDADNKDYGGELFVDGKIVRRSPEREWKVGCVTMPEDETVTEEAKCTYGGSEICPFEVNNDSLKLIKIHFFHAGEIDKSARTKMKVRK